MKQTNNIFSNITIILKPQATEEPCELIIKTIAWLQRRQKIVQFLYQEKSRLAEIYKTIEKKLPTKIKFLTKDEVYSKTDLIISMGGDGTLIGICRQFSKAPIPIFGVNLGDLGFITEFNKEDLSNQLARFFKGEYQIITQQLFSAKVLDENDKTVWQETFFNDATVSKTSISRIITIGLNSGDDHIFDTSGDGLIISSPIGSTAYSLSAGGPIVHPGVKAMIITPISPHSLTHRPLVIPDNSKLEVKLLGPSNSAILTLDGQTALPIDQQNRIIIQKKPKEVVMIVKNHDQTYFQTLKEKFIHGRRYSSHKP